MLFDNSDSSVKRGALIVFTMAVFFVGALIFGLYLFVYLFGCPNYSNYYYS